MKFVPDQQQCYGTEGEPVMPASLHWLPNKPGREAADGQWASGAICDAVSNTFAELSTHVPTWTSEEC